MLACFAPIIVCTNTRAHKILAPNNATDHGAFLWREEGLKSNPTSGSTLALQVSHHFIPKYHRFTGIDWFADLPQRDDRAKCQTPTHNQGKWLRTSKVFILLPLPPWSTLLILIFFPLAQLSLLSVFNPSCRFRLCHIHSSCCSFEFNS